MDRIGIAAIVLATVAMALAGFCGESDGDATDGFDESSGVLMVYGNANADRYLDSSDVAMIEQLASSGKYSRIADANMDGRISQEDAAVVERLIAGQETTMYYQDMTDGPTAIQYPVTSFMGVHQFVLIPMVAIGGLESMNGYTLSPSGERAATMLHDLYESERNVNTSYNMIDVEKLSSLKVKPKVVITYSKSLSNENKVEKSGIQVVHLDFSGFKQCVGAIRTAGFMIGMADSANRYVAFYEDVIRDIDEKVLSKLPEDQRKTVLCGYMTNCIDNYNGTYTPMAMAAGGKGVIEEGDTTYKEFNKGDEWMLSYNEDYFFYLNAWGYTDDIDEEKVYEEAAEYFKSLKSYKSGRFVVFNSIMPPALTVAYMAETLYPDLVGKGYGDSVNQRYIETYFPDFARGYRAADYTYVIAPETVRATGIALTQDASMRAGDTLRLSAEVLPENASDRTVTWSVDHTEVVSVDNGVVKALKEGTATVTATASDGGWTASCRVTVAAAEEPSGNGSGDGTMLYIGIAAVAIVAILAAALVLRRRNA